MIREIERDGKTYRMGMSITDVVPGDVIETTSGRLEIITGISRSGKWDKCIKTESGGTFGMMQVNAYGKKQ